MSIPLRFAVDIASLAVAAAAAAATRWTCLAAPQQAGSCPKGRVLKMSKRAGLTGPDLGWVFFFFLLSPKIHWREKSYTDYQPADGKRKDSLNSLAKPGWLTLIATVHSILVFAIVLGTREHNWYLIGHHKKKNQLKRVGVVATQGRKKVGSRKIHLAVDKKSHLLKSEAGVDFWQEKV